MHPACFEASLYLLPGSHKNLWLQRLRGYPLLVGLTFAQTFFVLPAFMVFLRSTEPQPAHGPYARLYGVPLGPAPVG